MRGVLVYVVLCVCVSSGFSQSMSPKREFRAVWIATVNNIDWPSRSGLSSEAQQTEFIALLDEVKRLGMNAVFVQVRPGADAFYESSYEPWSKWLSGTLGKPPEPYYDPLAFMLKEARRRQLEFHAWVNPFRVSKQPAGMEKRAIIQQKQHWMLNYGKLTLFNPGIPEVRSYLVNVIKDLVTRYEIDGLHFDDYFYPYPDLPEPLNDRHTFSYHKGKFRNIKNWRRHNINRFVEDVHKMLKQYAPKVKFGISPFGVWRNARDDPHGSPTRSGYTSYDHLYADSKQWVENGWVDYIAPQCYQSTKHNLTPFKPLVRWWNKNYADRHVYIGHAAYRFFSPKEKYTEWHWHNEFPEQLHTTRQYPKIQGSIFYSAKSLRKNKGGISDVLRKRFYRFPALVPTMAWKDSIPPNPPRQVRQKIEEKANKISWQTPQKAADNESVRGYVLYRFNQNETPDFDNPANILGLLAEEPKMYLDKNVQENRHYSYFLTALDGLKNESKPVKAQKTPIFPEEKNKSWHLPFSRETSAKLSDFFIRSLKKTITPIPFEIIEPK